jgi:hypothetical protein
MTLKRSSGPVTSFIILKTDIRANNNVSRSDSSTAIYSSLLYTNNARGNFPFFYQDINGNYIKNINASNNAMKLIMLGSTFRSLLLHFN